MRTALQRRTVSLLFSVFALLVSAECATAAAVIQPQLPCAVAEGRECYNFGVGSAGLRYLTFRQINFSVPSSGRAEVTFHGSLVCGADLSAGNKVIDLETQIVNASGAVPSVSQPGGLRQAMVLAPNTTQTFNLASTRAIVFQAATTQTFYFRAKPLRIDPGTNCYIYNAAFTVLFIP